MQTKAEGGFTLVELLLVIVILGILAAIVVAAVGNTSNNAAINACRTDVKSIRSVIQRALAQNPTWVATAIDNYSSLTPTYLADTPAGSNYTITQTDGTVAGTTGSQACT